MRDTSPPLLSPLETYPTTKHGSILVPYNRTRAGVCVRPGEAPRVCEGRTKGVGRVYIISIRAGDWEKVDGGDGGQFLKFDSIFVGERTKLCFKSPAAGFPDRCPTMEISINYSGMGDGSGIVVPGGGIFPSSRRSTARSDGIGGGGDGVVIAPNPSGIVIKTRLMEKKKGRGGEEEGISTFFDDDVSEEDDRGAYFVPPSLLSGICDGVVGESASGGMGGGDDRGGTTAKVFLNVCTHPLIARPGRRVGLDDRTGDEVDGWRIPMSMGDLRPCIDKFGDAAIVSDCVLNPDVVDEMNDDPKRLHFVCDLIVRCASRKFGRDWFGRRELDRRFKVSAVRYLCSTGERC